MKDDFTLESSIPVVRMLDETLGRAFYVDYLGYEIDWEHRFHDNVESPLYMQIRHDRSVLHLNGHATNDTPVCEVRIPVRNLARFNEYLRAKDADFEKPEIVDPRYEGRPTDMNLIDPFGNHLVFWSPSSFADWKDSPE